MGADPRLPRMRNPSRPQRPAGRAAIARLIQPTACLLATCAASAASAQYVDATLPTTKMRPVVTPDTTATVKSDGVWRYAISGGASFARGNSDSTTANARVDAARATATTKWTLYGRALYAKSEGEKTGDQLAAGTRYDADLNPKWFTFGQFDALRDEPANLDYRATIAAGGGNHLVRTDENSWDLLFGLAYSFDRYTRLTDINDQLRNSYGRVELVLGEESGHKLSDTTSFRQRLLIYPNLRDSGQVRGNFDAGLAVAMTKTLSLTAGLTVRYDSAPGRDVKKTDTLFVTGVSYKLD